MSNHYLQFIAMKRKGFLQLVSTLASYPLLAPLAGWAQKEKLKNWAGNIEYSTGNVFYPTNVAEVQQLIKTCTRVRALGTKHCFNTIADSKYNLISLKQMNKVVSLNASAGTVTVEGGIKYGELCPYLHEKGYALHNLASLPHISVAGSCSTATHGSGVANSNLSSAVKGLEIVIANGDILQLTKEKDGDTFLAAVVGLGAFGVITKVTLAIQPTFLMRQHVYLQLPMAALKNDFEAIVAAGNSVSLFTDWQTENINEVWIKNRVDAHKNYSNIPEFFGAKAAVKNMHPIADLSAENCTEQMGVPGPWYERMPHFKMGFTPSSGKELQTEYFIPQHFAVDAIFAVASLGKKIGPHLFITEIRTIAADDLWMSPCHNKASVAIHFTWKQEWEAVQQLLPQIEAVLAPFNPTPHWGKVFTMQPAVLASRYEKLAAFKKIVAGYDPEGKFKNDFLAATLYAVD